MVLTDTLAERPIAPPGTADVDAQTAWQPPGTGAAARRAGKVALGSVPLLALGLLVWYLLTVNHVVFWLRFDKVPTPGRVWATFAAQLTTPTFYFDLGASMRRIMIGFGLAAVLGTAVGIAVGRSARVSLLVRPVIEVLRPIPAIALVPLAILVFPTGEQGIVFITFFAAFFPVAVSTIHAMHSLPMVWEEAARTMGAGRRSILIRVVLPGAMPGIFSGLSVAMGVAWICVISAEMISGQFGIGYYTWQSYALLDYPAVIVGMLAIGVLGLGTAWLVERLGRRINRWLPRSER